MILNKKDEVFEYADKKYQVGEMVIANNQSDYVGLVGVITRIVTGDDKDTDNPYPDIYCDFIKPPFKDEVKILEENFSKWYGTKKKLEDLLSIEVVLVDERWTTKLATNRLLEFDMSRNKRKKIIDQMAAVVILQNYLDGNRGGM